jgi:alpha-glucosidase (family GH31 glycosyl hydrolase)
VFTVQPFLSTESTNFAEAVSKHLLVSERDTEHHIPALTRYKDVASAGMLDVTNNRTVPWIQAKLKALVDQYHIDAFYLDVGTAYDMPHYYRFENQLTNPDLYKTIFTNSILHAVGVVGVSSAITRPKAPVFVSLPPFASSWKSMQSIIPTVLTYGVMGYPFIMPGAVGGDYKETQGHDAAATNNATGAGNMSSENGKTAIHLLLPDKELYVRWLQLATFLPVIRYTHLPSKYGDEDVLEMAKIFTALRLKTVSFPGLTIHIH